MNNLSVRLVFDRKHVATKKHQALVQIEVTYAKQRKFFTSGIKLYSDQWGKDLKVKNHPQSLIFNQQLSDKVANIYEFAHQLELQKKKFTFAKLEQHMKGYDVVTGSSFLNFMRKRIEERPVSDITKIRHRCVLRALEEFGVIKDFADITHNAIHKWDEFAKSRCNMQSSVYNYHKILKVYVREAFHNQLINVDPYAGIKLNRGNTLTRKFLTKEELYKIETYYIENKSLERVRDVFIFCCYTGLAYADLLKFDFNKAEYTNGMYRIRDFRQKTETAYNISLMDKAVDILRKYNFVLPIISNQKYNSYLKVLGAYCKVKKNLTTHVARHTFATTIAMANGVRIEVISKMLGHTNIATTQLYAKVFQGEVDAAFNRLNNIV